MESGWRRKRSIITKYCGLYFFIAEDLFLHSSDLILFSGMEPLEHYSSYELVNSNGDGQKTGIGVLKSLSFDEIVRREPYLVFSIIFLCLRVALPIFPEMLSRLKALWISHALHLNLQVFGETSQIMGRVLHTVDLGRVWAKLRLRKTRSFHASARNARVWASSLASVSLGKSSSGSSSA